MTVPARRIQLFINGAWVTVTSDVYEHDPITVTTGRSPESNSPSPGTLRFSLKNVDGKYSPKNPSGPYYTKLGRSTPVRFAVDTSIKRLFSPSSTGMFDTTDRATTPDAAALDILGDLDLRIERSGRFDDGSLIAKTNAYYLGCTSQGVPYFEWYDAAANLPFAMATDAVPTQGRYAIRVTLDVDNGAAGNTVTFYTAPTLAGPWVQLGATVVQAGVTNVRNSLEGAYLGGGADSYTYKGQILNGIAGTVVANPDFTAQAEGATSFVDSTGKTWTVGGASSITSWSQRFTGEISDFQPSWDRSQNVATQQITASGVLRRMNQSAREELSAYYKAMNGRVPVAYWPLEDLASATELGAVSPNTSAMTMTGGIVLSTDTSFDCAKPLPAFTGPAGTTGLVPSFAPSVAGQQVRMLLKTTGASGSFNVQVLTSVAHKFVFAYTPSTDHARIDMYNQTTGILEFSIAPAFGLSNILNTTGGRLSLEFKQNGTGIDVNAVWLAPGAVTGFNFGITTIPTATLGQITAVQPFMTDPAITAIVGHISVENTISSIFDMGAVLTAYNNEGAATRINRMCLQDFILTEQIGSETGSAMGPEPLSILTTKLQSCVDADDGMLFESRAFAGLYYRARRNVQSIPSSFSVPFGSLNESTAPVEDDLLLCNDQTLTRDGGASARYQLTTGSLSILDAPNGVGRYSASDTLNLSTDVQLIYHAAWRVHLGTLDDARFPVISLDLHSPYLSPSLVAVLDIQLGDWIAITGPPVWFPAYEVQQQLTQVTETLTMETYNVTFAGRPARANRVPILDTPTARMDTGGAHLGPINTTSNVFQVATDVGPIWVTTAVRPTAFPFAIQCEGEIMTVTGIVGATSPQTFTVVRSVNGVVKSHPALAPVSLAEPSYLGV